MNRWLNITQPDFDTQLAGLLADREQAQDVSAVVRDIIHEVRARGDAALIDYTQRFDRLSLNPDGLRISEAEIDGAVQACEPAVREALQSAADRLRAYHTTQYPQDVLYTDASGTQLGWRFTPVDAVGLYVPGGRAAYPSSVLHNAIPAAVAGATRLVMVVPTPDDIVHPSILTAARIAGINEIYRIGGAQAIAALCFGTETIRPVDMIAGPGNAYVAEAKRQVFGRVGIDMIAGPSEILVVADDRNDPQWIAADLLSQSEHDPSAQSILITDSAAFADRVADALAGLLATLKRREIAGAAWERHGAIITVDTLDQAAGIINTIAPEHLELAVAEPETLAAQVRHAGAVFLGRYSPEAVGDYLAGPSHVLPTSRTARFSGGLSVYSFLKKMSLIGCSAASLRAIGPAAQTLADTEGLTAHARSLRLRLE